MSVGNTGKATQIKELLGSGLSAEVVSSAVGCDPSYISQLLSEESFASEVAAKRTLSLTAHSRRDASIDSIEDTLLGKLEEAVVAGVFYKPRDLLMATSVVNRMIRRGTPAATSGVVVNTVVQLSLPASVVKKYTVNRVGEVVAVEGQTMVTMPAHRLLQQLASPSLAPSPLSSSLGDDKSDKYQEALKYLPSGIETKIVDI